MYATALLHNWTTGTLCLKKRAKLETVHLEIIRIYFDTIWLAK